MSDNDKIIESASNVSDSEASESLIFFHSKLYPPESSSFQLERPRLLQIFKEYNDVKLILLHGPAGSGKTTLMKRFYDCSINKGASWLTLEEVDNDDGRFMSYLHAALGNPIETTSGHNANRVFKPYDSLSNSTSSILSKISNLPEGYTLFFDDFEKIQSESIHGLIQRFIQVLPSGGKVVISSRAMPKFSLGRLRAYGQLIEINQENLRFTNSEIKEFFQHQKTTSVIEDSMIDQLEETTEGWITALQLIALSLNNSRNDSSVFIRNFSGTNQELADYLAEDLLACQPEPVRDFLLQTSILETMDEDVCNTVCQRNDSQYMLDKLMKDNLFITTVNNKQGLYRYHNLFKEFLQQQLDVYYPEKIQDLHKAAALWGELNQRPTTAINHALKSGDLKLSAKLINDNMESFFFGGRLTTIVGWFERLPEEILDNNPRMLVYYTWCLVWMFGSHTRITYLLEKLEQPELLDKLDATTKSETLLIKPIYECYQDNFETSLKLCEQNLSSQGDLTLFSEGVLRNIKALCLIKLNRLKEACESAKRGRDSHDQCLSIYGQVYSDGFLGWAEYRQGKIQLALTILKDTLKLSMQDEFDRTAAVACASSYLMKVFYAANKTDEVKSLLSDFLPVINQLCMPDQIIMVYLNQARIDFQDQGYAEACKTLNAMRNIGQRRRHPRIISCAWGEQAHMALLAEDIVAAERYISLAKSSETYSQYDREEWFPIEMKLLNAQQKSSEALPLIKKEIRIANNNNEFLYVLTLNIVLSECLYLLGEKKKSLKELINAISFAAKEGIYRPFIDSGQETILLIKECRALYPDKVSEDFFNEIITSVKARKKLDQKETPHVENLTRREFDVLKLLARGHNNQTICNSLCLSLATVKTHLRNINSKLQAKSRTEAVAIARQYDLLE